MSDIECPYCGHITDHEHEGYEGEEVCECSDCEKSFILFVKFNPTYTLRKADCLNGAEHKYKSTNTCPFFATRMACVDCGKERDFTGEEWKAEEIRRGFDLKKELVDFFNDDEKADRAYKSRMGDE